MDQKILSELGDYLLAHREEIIAEWLRAVERNADIISSDHLNYKELVDHLPKLCDELTELLKNPPHNARFAYDFLEPVTLPPTILAMNSCGTRNLGAALIRLRIL